MKNRRRQLIVILIMAAAFVFGCIQLNGPVVKADGCPAYPSASQLSNCGGCTLVDYSEYHGSDGVVYYDCVYNCWGCPGPGSDPMTIEGYHEQH